MELAKCPHNTHYSAACAPDAGIAQLSAVSAITIRYSTILSLIGETQEQLSVTGSNTYSTIATSTTHTVSNGTCYSDS